MTEFSFKKLVDDSKTKPFVCGDEDLEDFFHHDAIKYAKELLAVTYLIESCDMTAAFFSVLNDKIINKDPSTNTTVSHSLARKVPNRKRLLLK